MNNDNSLKFLVECLTLKLDWCTQALRDAANGKQYKQTDKDGNSTDVTKEILMADVTSAEELVKLTKAYMEQDIAEYEATQKAKRHED